MDVVKLEAKGPVIFDIVEFKAYIGRHHHGLGGTQIDSYDLGTRVEIPHIKAPFSCAAT
jgi:hypothetical protein